MSIKVYRDGIEEISSIPVTVSHTREGHVVESYKVGGSPRHFVTLKDSFFCAHGDTVAEAVADALWKDPKQRPDREDMRKQIQAQGRDYELCVNEFRLLTGACLTGCRVALRKKGYPTDTRMKATDIRDKINREWGTKLLSILGWDK